ncbi:MAG: flagellar biosynthesis protein FlhB [Firmicutes bacterium]|nr:flagellar biosynthesis protein FlhB [Bacillota bacterium]
MRNPGEPLDLQLFAEERTEKATPRRREEARRRGQVIRSIEINSAVILLCTFLFLKIFGPWLGAQVANFAKTVLTDLIAREWGTKTVYLILFFSAVAFFQISLPVMGIALGAGLASNLLQVGFLFTPSPLAPRLDRINPFEGLRRIFSRRALLELVKSGAKVVVVGYLAYSTIKANFSLFPRLLDMSVPEAVSSLGELSTAIILRIGLLLLVLAIFDYAFQYWEHEKSLRMTKQELKEEFRQYEGDPRVRARIRQRQRQISYRRMMQQVPKADVVITNPTHYAVALQYIPEQMAAPLVLAKGVDELALRIKAIAREHGITIFEDPPLAQTLYKTVEVGDLIPPELYEAVAQVLAFVYRLRPNHFRKKGVI